MRFTSLVLLGGLAGCASFPSAHLVVNAGVREQIAAPVVCGPVGFRKVPLQSRWGEFVRVTVAAPVVLRGDAFVHANGVGQPAQQWSTDTSGNLVIESRFENLDPDQRFALSSERPIDITITGLEAPAGGTCEGAVFTVEQGALVPSISDAAWEAELERRGGPELVARREAARVEAEARRQAHYAAWASRHVEVSAEVVAQADVVRQAHYAAWEARRNPQVVTTTEVVASAEVQGGGEVAMCPANSGGVPVSGSGGGVVMSGGAGGVASCGGAVVTSEVVSSGGVVTNEAVSSGAVVTNATVATGAVASGTVSGGAVAVTSPTEWSQPSEANLRADVTVNQPGSEWVQPYAPRLDAVVVNTESQVAVATAPVAPPSCNGNCGGSAVVGFEAVLPALFQVMFNFGGVVAPAPQQQSNVHGAVPVNPSR
jgi:hypothetical protein